MFKEDLLKGKRILVTGGGTGLGKEMATHYGQHGADLYICGRRENVLKDTATEIEDKYDVKVNYETLDIRASSDVEGYIDGIFQEGPLDGLVNNAAGNFISPTERLSHRAFDIILDIVLKGSKNCTLSCGKYWIENNIPGHVLNIVTTYASTGSGYVVPSAMAKAGVLAMTRSLAVEWAKYGQRHNAIAPGPFPTKGAWDRLNPGGDNDSGYMADIPLGRVGEMSELQNLATFLMADGCDYLTGQTIAIDGAQYLTGGGTFSKLDNLSEEDWEQMRAMIRSSNNKDKADRN